MTPSIGFVLLTHNKPHQIMRLVLTLNRMFDHPPIVCHHDFSKSSLPVDLLPGNLSLVQSHLQTEWGKFSLVEAVLQALPLLYQSSASPDWFVLLSASDYPIKPAKQILSDLASSEYDVHISHKQINYESCEGRWQKLCYQRYCALKFRVPWLSSKLRLTRREVVLENPLLAAPFVPFSNKFHCFAGSNWFCANRKAAEYLIEFHRSNPALKSHYRRLDSYTIVPDESYYHTVLCNASHLKASQNYWRYIDWSKGGAHPKTLRLEDLPKLQASSAHFARKFDIDADARVLDELDAIIG